MRPFPGMPVRASALLLAAALLSPLPALADPLAAAIAAPHRTEAFAARDAARNPLPVLRFFGVQPEHTVVELWPGAGWWAEILAPYLRDNGRYIAASFAPHPNPGHYFNRLHGQLEAKLAATPALYDRVQVTRLGAPDQWVIAPPGSADVVLTFRNIHSFLNNDIEREVFAAAFRALKPGGVLGVVTHRGADGLTREAMTNRGYVPESYVIQLATQAGFVLEEKSEVNANPRDTKDHPHGVWSLPPALQGGDVDRDRYLAIGESDRMTLRFRKPGA